MWREKPPDAESAVGAAFLKVWANARTCPVHAVLGTVSHSQIHVNVESCRFHFSR
jgi:hypothetical protein